MKRKPPELLSDARARRAQGQYDRTTLRGFHRSWYQRRDPASLISWLGFRRDLGYPLQVRHYTWLSDALGRGWMSLLLHGVSPTEVKRGRMLCQEYEFHEGLPSPRTQGLRRPRWSLWRSEVQWRAEFLAWMSERGSRGVALVGNGIQGRESILGREIEGCGTVLRFNHYSSAEGPDPLLDSRLDAWVRAPDFRGPSPPVEWLILAGPASQFTLWHWGPIMRQVEQGSKLVCVPLDIWGNLVRRLESPPSSGLLMAFWLSRLPEVGRHLRLFGFGHDPERDRVYHHARPRHPASSRHNWSRERTLLAELMGEGPGG